jgi:hypothetical protein
MLLQIIAVAKDQFKVQGVYSIGIGYPIESKGAWREDTTALLLYIFLTFLTLLRIPYEARSVDELGHY